ncbi:MAG: PorT family protein [Cyclobacteriaceae bacterium]
MKKNILLIGLTIGILSAQAQIKGFVGVKGGGQVSTVYIEHTIYNTFLNAGFISGYNGGVMLKLFTNQSKSSFLNAGLQTGLGFERKGWRQIFVTDEPSHRTRLSYANLPVEALIYGGKGNTKIFVTIGIYAELLVQHEKSPDPDLNNIGNGVEFYTYQEGRDNKFGYGGRLSLGVQHQFPFGLIHLDGFFTYSLSSVIKNEDLSDRLPDLTNQYVFGFTAAYLIPFGKMKF